MGGDRKRPKVPGSCLGSFPCIWLTCLIRMSDVVMKFRRTARYRQRALIDFVGFLIKQLSSNGGAGSYSCDIFHGGGGLFISVSSLHVQGWEEVKDKTGRRHEGMYIPSQLVPGSMTALGMEVDEDVSCPADKLNACNGSTMPVTDRAMACNRAN